MKNIVGCRHPNCSLHAHAVNMSSDWFIFQILMFDGMTCFEIAHHPKTSNLWVSNPKFKIKPEGIDTRQCNEKKAYSVCMSHLLYVQLRREYGLELKSRRMLTEVQEDDNSIDQVIVTI